MEDVIIAFLYEHKIPYELYKHEAVFSVQAGKYLHNSIAGAHSKNLFLRSNQRDYFLISILCRKRLDIKKLAKDLDRRTFSFSSAQELFEKLKLVPGVVTPLGLIHDQSREVNFVLDEDFMNYKYINFHPINNDKTINLTFFDFIQVMKILGHAPRTVTIPKSVQ